MSETGWIKLHRSLIEKGYYTDSEYVHLWVHLLLVANHAEKEFLWNGKIIKLKPGQLVTGRTRLSKETGIEASKVERILKCLKSEQQIEQQMNSKFRLITINNYSTFQKSEQQIEQQMNSKRTASEHKQECKELKNVKKDKNLSKERESAPPPLDSSLPESTQVSEASGTPPQNIPASPSQVFGNPEINQMLAFLLKTFGLRDFKESRPMQRRYGHHIVNLYNKIGKETFKKSLTEIAKDSFKSKNCNSLIYLYGQLKSSKIESGLIQPEPEKRIVNSIGYV